MDAQNRVVLLHGVNAVWKVAPYYPPSTTAGFSTADADFLAANGFNAVRLGVLFAGVMPQQGVIDTAYLDQIDRVVKLLAARHIWVLLDFHQDMLNEKWQGEGFPDWASPDTTLPNDAVHGFPLNEFASLALNEAYDSFWANDNGIWTDYGNAWTAVAARWRDQPYLLGYDLFNEPWPGTQWPTCFELDCFLFDAKLHDFFTQILAALRVGDPEHIAFIEPQQLFDFGSLSAIAAIPDDNLGMSWHSYCSATLLAPNGVPVDGPDCTLVNIESMTFDHAETQIAMLGATTLLTEFGATDDLADIGRVTGLADQNFVGWTYWHYKNWGDPTGGPGIQGLFADDADLSTLKQDKADLLVRPYPRATAGTPTALSFDTTTKAFSYSFTPDGSAHRSEIFAPARHYPNGYDAVITGGHAVSAANATLLQVVADPGASTVQIQITPH